MKLKGAVMKPVVMVIHVNKDGTINKTKHTDVTVPVNGRIRWVTEYPGKQAGPKLKILIASLMCLAM